MSKNVAVFVDVANIFYAAKAAGVDIDYVTLLKSATAGRDFVRAYAYTGLDPENENQRQFHAFLGRSGYKVISKDIRKYGDGRIKANLDIELVVDMMRMAQHIDIAVVVSGDGDFAPAIRAVQQLGVRAEVISFRGNTSSDLIDVADVFTDITQIARVEKGARSGRRVAAEGDLSMTEVPEKETEGLARRRRSRRGERDEQQDRVAVADRVSSPDRGPAPDRHVADAGMPGNLIVLPGERLSRVAGDGEVEADDAEIVTVAEFDGVETESTQGPAGESEADGRRRRRRRGGRGRGRGRQGEMDQPSVGVAATPETIDAMTDDDEFLEEEIAPLPQHSTFGSVWDSQLGVTPTVPLAASSGAPLDPDEEFDDEPEIPEYLLAERRQQQQRGRGGRGMRPGAPGGRRAGYQAAMDRERYGRQPGSTGGSSGFASGFSAGPPRNDRNRAPVSGNRGPRPQQQPRPSRPIYQDVPRDVERVAPQSSSEPWSEVPADVQELLRAELARRQAGSGQNASRSQSAAPVAEPAAEPAAPARGRGRSTRSASPARAGEAEVTSLEAAVSAESPAADAPVGAAPARRGRRPATAPAVAAGDATSAADTDAAAGEAAGPAPRARRPRASAATAPTEESTPTGTEAPKTRRASTPRATRSRATSSPAAGSSDSGEGPTSGGESATDAPAPRRRSTRKVPTEPAGSQEG